MVVMCSSIIPMSTISSPPLRNLTFHHPLLPSSSSSSASASSHPLRKNPTLRFTATAKIRSLSREAEGYDDPKAGVAVYKPKSYEVLVTDAANSLAFALQDGNLRLEIDFPTLPSNISSYKGSSDEFIDANIQLALAVVRKLQEKKETGACIVFPDKPEKRRATQLFKAALDSVMKTHSL